MSMCREHSFLRQMGNLVEQLGNRWLWYPSRNRWTLLQRKIRPFFSPVGSDGSFGHQMETKVQRWVCLAVIPIANTHTHVTHIYTRSTRVGYFRLKKGPASAALISPAVSPLSLHLIRPLCVFPFSFLIFCFFVPERERTLFSKGWNTSFLCPPLSFGRRPSFSSTLLLPRPLKKKKKEYWKRKIKIKSCEEKKKTHPPLVAVLHQLPAGAVLFSLSSAIFCLFLSVYAFHGFPLDTLCYLLL